MRAALILAMALSPAACRKADPADVGEPHQILDDFTLDQSESGTPLWSLKARSALLKEDKRQALLTEPRMDFFKKSRVVTQLSAAGGVISTDTSDLDLSSSVVVRSLEDQSVLKTENLQYSSKKKKFLTESDVAVSRPGGTLRGRGLEANPDLSEIRIFHQTSVIDKGGQP